ncbi:olfactory receptor 52P1-like [Carettochelys insculpta]|uniref:olfactory receptor 52P1-like n=1 Tax=Carettochelys insculpta TaxID=44489 RepID=UPI003EBA15E0
MTLLFIVGKEQSLHQPMYLLLCMLAISDISTPTSVVPKVLCIFWFDLKDITLGGCLTQMFSIHVGAMIHSAILVTMAFDRYVAICNPLRYTTILSNARIAMLGLVGLIRAVIFVLPLPVLVSRLPFCANRIIPHTYCDHIVVAKMSCGDITVNSVYALTLVFVTISLDLTLIGLSYRLIIRAVLKISFQKAYQKAFNTCSAHMFVILVSYPVFIFSCLTHRFSHNVPPEVHIILTNLYYLLVPMFNPVVYGVKTKELREKISKYFCRMSSPGVTDI